MHLASGNLDIGRPQHQNQNHHPHHLAGILRRWAWPAASRLTNPNPLMIMITMTMMMMMGVQCQRVLNIFSRVFGALVAISQRTDRHAASIKKNCFRYQVSLKCRPEKVQGEAF